jgi:hypothetical protein
MSLSKAGAGDKKPNAMMRMMLFLQKLGPTLPEVSISIELVHLLG